VRGPPPLPRAVSPFRWPRPGPLILGCRPIGGPTRHSLGGGLHATRLTRARSTPAPRSVSWLSPTRRATPARLRVAPLTARGPALGRGGPAPAPAPRLRHPIGCVAPGPRPGGPGSLSLARRQVLALGGCCIRVAQFVLVPAQFLLGLAHFGPGPISVPDPKSRVPAQVRPVTVRLVSDGCPDSACHVSCSFVSFHRLFSSLCF